MRSTTRLHLAFKEAGWKLHRIGKHEIWRCPCGEHTITSATTVSGGRGDGNCLSRLRRFSRQCTENMGVRAKA